MKNALRLSDFAANNQIGNSRQKNFEQPPFDKYCTYPIDIIFFCFKLTPEFELAKIVPSPGCC
jgi:hypothetical protein